MKTGKDITAHGRAWKLGGIALGAALLSACTYDGYGGGVNYRTSSYYSCDPYASWTSYYSCDNSYGFANIGYGGGWYQDYYYPGHGYYVYNRAGNRLRMNDNYRRYWAQQRHDYLRRDRHRGENRWTGRDQRPNRDWRDQRRDDDRRNDRWSGRRDDDRRWSRDRGEREQRWIDRRGDGERARRDRDQRQEGGRNRWSNRLGNRDEARADRSRETRNRPRYERPRNGDEARANRNRAARNRD